MFDGGLVRRRRRRGVVELELVERIRIWYGSLATRELITSQKSLFLADSSIILQETSIIKQHYHHLAKL